MIRETTERLTEEDKSSKQYHHGKRLHYGSVMYDDNNVEAIKNKVPLIPRRKLLHKQSKSPAVFKLSKKRKHTLSLGRRSSPGYSLKKVTNFHNYRYSSNFQQWKASSLLTLNFKSLVLTTLFPIRSANIVKTVTSSVEPP